MFLEDQLPIDSIQHLLAGLREEYEEDEDESLLLPMRRRPRQLDNNNENIAQAHNSMLLTRAHQMKNNNHRKIKSKSVMATLLGVIVDCKPLKLINAPPVKRCQFDFYLMDNSSHIIKVACYDDIAIEYASNLALGNVVLLENLAVKIASGIAYFSNNSIFHHVVHSIYHPFPPFFNPVNYPRVYKLVTDLMITLKIKFPFLFADNNSLSRCPQNAENKTFSDFNTLKFCSELSCNLFNVSIQLGIGDDNVTLGSRGCVVDSRSARLSIVFSRACLAQYLHFLKTWSREELAVSTWTISNILLKRDQRLNEILECLATDFSIIKMIPVIHIESMNLNLLCKQVNLSNVHMFSCMSTRAYDRAVSKFVAFCKIEAISLPPQVMHDAWQHPLTKELITSLWALVRIRRKHQLIDVSSHNNLSNANIAVAYSSLRLKLSWYCDDVLCKYSLNAIAESDAIAKHFVGNIPPELYVSSLIRISSVQRGTSSISVEGEENGFTGENIYIRCVLNALSAWKRSVDNGARFVVFLRRKGDEKIRCSPELSNSHLGVAPFNKNHKRKLTSQSSCDEIAVFNNVSWEIENIKPLS